jgi:RNA polymerase sigma-70 factor, ECF subfamily
MLTLDAIRAAVLSDQPWKRLDELVRAEQAAGRKVKEIYADLMGMADQIDATPNLSEEGSDAFGDTLDALTGYCHRDCQYKDSPNATPITTKQLSDNQLIAAVADGGTPEISVADAMNALIQRHSDSVRRYLLSRGLQPGDAEDVAQDVFVTVFARAHTYQPQPNSIFLNWLMWITRNAWVDHLRRNGQSVPSLDEIPVPFEGARNQREPIAYALNRELAEVTEEGLGTAVTPAQRFVLEVECGLTPTHHVDVSPPSWATQRTRGLERLGEYVARHMWPEWLPQLEQLPDDERRVAHRRIGEEGMEALSRERLGAGNDNAPQEQ